MNDLLISRDVEQLVGKALRKLGLLAVDSALPIPEYVLYGESEKAITCFYYFGGRNRPRRLVAVKSPSTTGSLESLWKKLKFGNPALQPINAQDEGIIIFDDGARITTVLRRLSLISESQDLPKPAHVLTGRAGLSRLYLLNLRRKGLVQTLVAKFDRPDRAAREWKKINELQEQKGQAESLLTISGNNADDGLMLFEYFGSTAYRAQAFEKFACEQIEHAKHISSGFNKIGAYLKTFYGVDNLERGYRTWRFYFAPVIKNALVANQWYYQSWAWAIADSAEWIIIEEEKLALPNPFFEIHERLQGPCGQTVFSLLHGDLQTTNILVALDHVMAPDRIAVLDFEKRTKGPILTELAGLETDLLRSVIAPTARQVLGFNLSDDLAILAILHAHQSLLGLPLNCQHRVPDFLLKAATSFAYLLFCHRQMVAPFLRQKRSEDHVTSVQYFHFLLFQQIRAMNLTSVHTDRLKLGALLIGAAYAELSIRIIHKGQPGLEDPCGFPRKWEDVLLRLKGGVISHKEERAWASIVQECTKQTHTYFRLLGGTLSHSIGFRNFNVSRSPTPSELTELNESKAVHDEIQIVTDGYLPTIEKERSPDEAVGIRIDSRPAQDRVAEFLSANTPALVAIVGAPGEGKSTLASYIAWRAASESIARKSLVVPILVSVKQFADAVGQSRSVEDAAETFFANAPEQRLKQKWPPSEWWGRRLQNDGQLLIIFDGLDELESQPQILGELIRYINETWISCGNRVVVTCRTNSYSRIQNTLLPGQVWYLEGWGVGSSEWRKYIKNYPGGLNDIDQLCTKLSEPWCMSMSRVPFLLDLLCVISAKSEFSTRTAVLRNGLLELIAVSLGGNKQDRKSLLPMLRDPAGFYEHLCRLGLKVQIADPGKNAFAMDRILEYCRKDSPKMSASQAAAFVRICSAARLIAHTATTTFTGTRGEFAHNSILEHLAAGGIAQSIRAQRDDKARTNEARRQIANRLGHPAWTETLGCVPAMLEDPRIFLRMLLNAKDNLSRDRAALAARSLTELGPTQREMPQISECVRHCWNTAAAYFASANRGLASELLGLIPSLYRAYSKSLSAELLLMLERQQPFAIRSALEFVANLGSAVPEQDRVIERLVGMINSAEWDISIRAGTALKSIGESGVRPLLLLLGASDSLDTSRLALVIDVLGEVGKTSPKTRKAIGTALRPLINVQQPWRVRAAACRAIGESCERDANKLADVLLEYIKDDGFSASHDPIHAVRARACEGLSSLSLNHPGEQYRIANELILLLDDRVSLVARAAMVCLQRQSNVIRDESIFAILARRVSSATPQGRAHILGLLASIPSVAYNSERDSRHIVDLLSQGEFKVREQACNAVARLELTISDHPGLVETLKACFESKSEELARASGACLLSLMRDQDSKTIIWTNYLRRIIMDSKCSSGLRRRALFAVGNNESLMRDGKLAEYVGKLATHAGDYSIRHRAIRDLSFVADSVRKDHHRDQLQWCILRRLSDRTKVYLRTYDSVKTSTARDARIRNAVSRDLDAMVRGQGIDNDIAEIVPLLSSELRWALQGRQRPLTHWMRRAIIDAALFRDLAPHQDDSHIMAAALQALGRLPLSALPSGALGVVAEGLCVPKWYVVLAALEALSGELRIDAAKNAIVVQRVAWCMESPDPLVRAAACELATILVPAVSAREQDDMLVRIAVCLVDHESEVRRRSTSAVTNARLPGLARTDYLFNDVTHSLYVRIGGDTEHELPEGTYAWPSPVCFATPITGEVDG